MPLKEDFISSLGGRPPDYLGDYSDDMITRRNGVNRNTVKNCLSKLREFRLDNAMNDVPMLGKPMNITDEDKAGSINIACTK